MGSTLQLFSHQNLCTGISTVLSQGKTSVKERKKKVEISSSLHRSRGVGGVPDRRCLKSNDSSQREVRRRSGLPRLLPKESERGLTELRISVLPCHTTWPQLVETLLCQQYLTLSCLASASLRILLCAKKQMIPWVFISVYEKDTLSYGPPHYTKASLRCYAGTRS